MSQTHANRNHRDRYAEEEVAIPSSGVDAEKVKQEIDDLMDEIDAMLEDGTSELTAQHYKQAGGQ